MTWLSKKEKNSIGGLVEKPTSSGLNITISRLFYWVAINVEVQIESQLYSFNKKDFSLDLSRNFSISLLMNFQYAKISFPLVFSVIK